MSFRILCCLLGATGATVPANALDVDEAIRRAWAADPVAAALALTPELARAREEQAGIRPNPEVEVRASTPAPFDDAREWGVGVGVTQRVPRRERIEQARAYARLGGEVGSLRLQEQRRLLAGQVRELCYEMAVQQRRIDLARRTLGFHEELRGMLERRQAAGEIAATEIEMLNLEADRAAQVLTLAEAEYAALVEQLRARLRLARDVPIVIQTDLDEVLARPIPDLPADLAQARPELALAHHAVRTAESGLGLAQAESRSDWTVGAGFDFERRANDVDGRLENEPRLSLMASAPWPRTLANRGEIRERRTQVRVAEAELAAARQNLRAEIVSLITTARLLQPVILAQHRTMAAKQDVPSSLLAAYERGELSGQELAQARRLRFALHDDYLHAADRYVSILAAAETAAGLIPLEP